MVFPFALLPLNAERGGVSFGAGAGVDGPKFQLSRWSQGHMSHRTAKMKLVLPFSHSRQKFGIAII